MAILGLVSTAIALPIPYTFSIPAIGAGFQNAIEMMRSAATGAVAAVASGISQAIDAASNVVGAAPAALNSATRTLARRGAALRSTVVNAWQR